MAESWRKAFGVAACSEADEELAGPMRRTSPTSRVPWRGETYSSFRNPGEGMSKRRGLATAGLRSEREDYRQFIENDGRIFDKHGVWEIGLGGKRDNAGRPNFPSRIS